MSTLNNNKKRKTAIRGLGAALNGEALGGAVTDTGVSVLTK